MRKFFSPPSPRPPSRATPIADEPATTFQLGGFFLAWLGPDGNPLDGLMEAGIGKDALAVSSSAGRSRLPKWLPVPA
jgi:hypothetical protein